MYLYIMYLKIDIEYAHIEKTSCAEILLPIANCSASRMNVHFPNQGFKFQKITLCSLALCA